MYKNLYLEENIFTHAEYHSRLLIQDFYPAVKKNSLYLPCLLSRKQNKSLKNEFIFGEKNTMFTEIIVMSGF